MITDFLITLFDTPPQSGDEDYLRAGCLSSLGIMRLVVAIEQRFNIEITEADLMRPDFKTLNGLERLIADKRCSEPYQNYSYQKAP